MAQWISACLFALSANIDTFPIGIAYGLRGMRIGAGGNLLIACLTSCLLYTSICRMEAYRDYNKFEKCAKCELLPYCRGCPAVASGKDGNFYAADPQCWNCLLYTSRNCRCTANMSAR